MKCTEFLNFDAFQCDFRARARLSHHASGDSDGAGDGGVCMRCEAHHLTVLIYCIKIRISEIEWRVCDCCWDHFKMLKIKQTIRHNFRWIRLGVAQSFPSLALPLACVCMYVTYYNFTYLYICTHFIGHVIEVASLKPWFLPFNHVLKSSPNVQTYTHSTHLYISNKSWQLWDHNVHWCYILTRA